MMDENTTVEIRQVSNGYVVMPAMQVERNMMVGDDQDRLVFQTFAELSAWLMQHFTHRAAYVSVDAA